MLQNVSSCCTSIFCNYILTILLEFWNDYQMHLAPDVPWYTKEQLIFNRKNKKTRNKRTT